MTIDELAKALEERGASLQIHWSVSEWSVWLYAPEDSSSTFYICSNVDLETAIEEVLQEWST